MKTTKFFAILLTLIGAAAYAQDNTATSRGYLSGLEQNYFNGFAPFVGLGAGYMAYTDELDVEGAPTQATILGSWTAPAWGFAFDGGVGFRNQTFSQEAAVDRNVQTTLLEVAARYQNSNGWQFGPVFNTMFNEGENFGANQADAQFVGLQALKEFDISQQWLMRAGGRYMTDVNVNGTWLNMAMIDVQFGWKPAQTSVRSAAANEPSSTFQNYDEEDSDLSRAAITDADEIPADQNASHPGLVPMGESSDTAASADNSHETMGSTGDTGSTGEQTVSSEDSEMTALKDALLFDVASSELNSDSQQKLENLAAALEENPDIVGTIEVVGYADPNGNDDFNMNLSRERAMAVKDALVAEGLGDNQIQVVALGEVDAKESDYAKSRRAEIRFKDVKDKEKLEQIVSDLE